MSLVQFARILNQNHGISESVTCKVLFVDRGKKYERLVWIGGHSIMKACIKVKKVRA